MIRHIIVPITVVIMVIICNHVPLQIVARPVQNTTKTTLICHRHLAMITITIETMDNQEKMTKISIGMIQEVQNQEI